MRKLHIIKFVVLILTISVVGEITVAIDHEDAISFEIDGDGEEKEEKNEDKLRESLFNLGSSAETQELQPKMATIYLPQQWKNPVIDEDMDPPEFV